MKRIMHFAGWWLFTYGDKIIKVFADGMITKFQLFISKPLFCFVCLLDEQEDKQSDGLPTQKGVDNLDTE